MKELEESYLLNEYKTRYPHYLFMGELIQKHLNEILKYNEIAYDYVQMRIKEYTSFIEKISRANFKNPFHDNEDFCGLRIIHLFDDDLEIIKKLIRDEFQIVKEVDKTLVNKDPEKHKEREFSYRSFHFIVSLKNCHYKDNLELKSIVAEIQIRTISMHVWAAIEHKLNYKKQKDFPEEFRYFFTRKFSQMSAVLEIADEFFVSLRNEKNNIIKKYKVNLSSPELKEKVLDEVINIDVLQAYLENKFPNYSQVKERIIYLLEEMRFCGLTLRDIENGERILKEKKLLHLIKQNYPTDNAIPTQTGIVRLILDITNNGFFSFRKNRLHNSKWIKFVYEIKSQID